MPTKTRSAKRDAARTPARKSTRAKKRTTTDTTHHSASRHASARKAPAGARASAAPRYFELRRSPIQGLGAFATVPIKKGTKIIEYTGERISNDEADRRYDDSRMKRHHTFLFTLSSRTIVDGNVNGNEARFINHSCDPNCEAIIDRSRIWIYAKRNIQPGEELVYDYQYEWYDDYTDEDVKLYVCHCGAKNCRGTILKKPRRKG